MSALQLPANTLQDTSSRRSCVNGSLLPNIYVLGAQKAATTTLALALIKAGIRSSTEVIEYLSARGKESFLVAHKFKDYARRNITDLAVLNEFAAEWRSQFSSCERFEEAEQVAEFTAENLAFTDPAFSKDWPTLSVAKEDLFTRDAPLLGFDLPPLLRQSYGDMFDRVRFVALLREPIGRAQSALYQFSYFHKNSAAKLSFDPATHLREELRALVEDHVVSYNIWQGLYGRQLQEWFSYWPSSQFLVLPYNYLTSDKATVCRSIKQHLQTTMKCSKLVKRRNDKFSHPEVEEQVPEDLLFRAVKALEGEFYLLIDVLVNNSDVQMPVLELYAGKKGPVTHAVVREWLADGW